MKNKLVKNKTFIIKGFLATVIFILLGGTFNYISSNYLGYDFDEDANFIWKFIVWSVDAGISMFLAFLIIKAFNGEKNYYYDRKTLFFHFTFLSIFQLVCSTSAEFGRFAVFIALFFALYSGYSELD